MWYRNASAPQGSSKLLKTSPDVAQTAVLMEGPVFRGNMISCKYSSVEIVLIFMDTLLYILTLNNKQFVCVLVLKGIYNLQM